MEVLQGGQAAVRRPLAQRVPTSAIGRPAPVPRVVAQGVRLSVQGVGEDSGLYADRGQTGLAADGQANRVSLLCGVSDTIGVTDTFWKARGLTCRMVLFDR